MKKILMLSILVLLLGTAAFADNVISLSKAELGWSISGDNLTISMSAKTKGWISVGLGSKRMDGSVMFFGYVKNGESFLRNISVRGTATKRRLFSARLNMS